MIVNDLTASSRANNQPAFAGIHWAWKVAAATANWWTKQDQIQDMINRVDGLQERIDALNAYMKVQFRKPYLRRGTVVFAAPDVTIKIAPREKNSEAGLAIQVIEKLSPAHLAPPERFLYPHNTTRSNAEAWVANANVFDDAAQEALLVAAPKIPPRPGFTSMFEFTDSLNRQKLRLPARQACMLG